MSYFIFDPEEKKNAEVMAMIETYNKQVSFVDFDSLAPVVESILV